MFKLQFSTGNAAFGENQFDRADEISRILIKVSEQVGDLDLVNGKIYDANGNHIGDWEIA